MTQSKKDDNTIVIDLNDTYGTTTTYWAGDNITDIVIGDSIDGTFTIDINDLTTDTIDISSLDNITSDYQWAYENTKIDKLEIEKMCKEYPALEKTWRNFKSVYDMVKQDYEGKKKAGEIDEDDIPF
jgi:phosphopantetheine adenylyltransferase